MSDRVDTNSEPAKWTWYLVELIFYAAIGLGFYVLWVASWFN